MSNALRKILDMLRNVRKAGAGFVACCPAHEDDHASLSISLGADGRVLLYCHAGCKTPKVVSALGLKMNDLAPPNGASRSKPVWRLKDECGLLDSVAKLVKGQHVGTWVYFTLAREEAFRVARFNLADGSKQFRPYYSEAGGWVIGDPPGRLPLYRAPDVAAGNPIVLVEGEKCAEIAAEQLGLVATTSAHGANGAAKSDWSILSDKDIIVLPDEGTAGRAYSDNVLQQLAAIRPPPKSVLVVQLPGLGDGEDIEQFVERHGPNARGELERLIAGTQPNSLEPPSGPSEYAWPVPLSPDAHQGLAGEFVRIVSPHSESDPAALLIQFLICFGNIIGRGAFQVVEADKHHTNLFAVLVGRTSKGRKGASLGRVRSVMEGLDEQWGKRIASGLSSGEGLIFAVRDRVTEQKPIFAGSGMDRHLVRYEEVIADEGEADKRLLVVEAEFASVLRVIARETNTLSAIVRQAWDRGDLRTLTKNSPVRASDAHISIIGHVTRDEVRRHVAETEIANGFCNRFLWVCVQRSKLLPEGGKLCSADLEPLRHALKERMEFARTVGALRRDDAARNLWATVYPTLSAGKAGLLGAVTSRSEAQVLRLAVLYALLDGAAVIQAPHLRAALEIWRYCEESARYTFGAALGDPIADALLRMLQAAPDGLTRTEIRDGFGRHKGAPDIGWALQLLQGEGLVDCHTEGTGGRSAERWCFTAGTCDKSDRSDQT